MNLLIKQFGLIDYETCYSAMCEFNPKRTPETPDEIWVLQHPPVYTLGLNAGEEHLLDTKDIPVIKTDRGGQVTYHGPGQLIIYLLLDLNRNKLGAKKMVRLIEQSIIDLLEKYGLHASRRPGAPGVYVEQKKIAALGIRIKRGCSYHGLALNVNMDLNPFSWIDPCGYPGLEVTQLSDQGIQMDLRVVTTDLLECLTNHLNLQGLPQKRDFPVDRHKVA